MMGMEGTKDGKILKKKLANWGNYPVLESEEFVFSREQEAQEFLNKTRGAGVIPRGNGRCYGDASLAETTLTTLKYDRIISFDRDHGILECESGITLDAILEFIVPLGWYLPVSPGTKYITLGGAVGSNIHGKNHHIDGTFCNHVLDLDILIASGEVYSCSAERNPDLFEATCGGMGLTGLILRVRFLLKKIETSFIKQKQVKASNLSEILELFEQYKHFPYSMAWIDCLKKGSHYGRSIMMMGENARMEDLNPGQRTLALKVHSRNHLNFRMNIPSFALNYYTIKTFNFLYYHKNLGREINNIVHYDPFFYPLDSILNWNRAYGKKGVIQYQFVLPKQSSEKGLVDILHRINKKGLGSFLAVLKLFGPQKSLISFPMEGYTLALDFPVRDNLLPFLDELDRVVLDYGGRLYLTKDARMKPEVFWSGYPNAPRFQEIIRKYNPEFRFRSLLSDRLHITKPLSSSKN